MVAVNMKEEVSKPKTKSLKARVRQMKEDMRKIREDQRSIREEQSSIGDGFQRQVKQQCDELKLETQVILKQSTFNRIRLSIMFDMVQARQDGDFDRAAALTRFLTAFNKGRL